MTALMLGLLTAGGLVAQQAVSSPQIPRVLTLRIVVVGSAEEANRVLERLKRGDAFAVVARAESIDPSARDGGLLGRLELAALRTEVRRAVEGLQPGDLSPVVPVATGFAVLQVVPDLAGSPAPLNPASFAAISAVGSVKYVPDVGGLPEAEAVLRDFPKPADWNLNPRLV